MWEEKSFMFKKKDYYFTANEKRKHPKSSKSTSSLTGSNSDTKSGSKANTFSKETSSENQQEILLDKYLKKFK